MAAAVQGRRIVLMTAFILNLIALVCLFISFVTPYWYISWPRVYSGFRKIGLWEACFAGQVVLRDSQLKSYHGCWWILAPELYNIRDWVMPPWFIIVQILITFSLVAEIVCIIFLLLIWMRTSRLDSSGIGVRRAPFNYVQGATWITIITTISKAVAVIMFALGAKYDIDWMNGVISNWAPHPEWNYPHVSFGLAVVSTFFTMFASMPLRVYRRIVAEDYRSGSHGGKLTTSLPPLTHRVPSKEAL